jgi:hypothetical protein
MFILLYKKFHLKIVISEFVIKISFYLKILFEYLKIFSEFFFFYQINKYILYCIYEKIDKIYLLFNYI